VRIESVMIHPESPHGATIRSFQTEGAGQAEALLESAPITSQASDPQRIQTVMAKHPSQTNYLKVRREAQRGKAGATGRSLPQNEPRPHM